MGVILGAVLCGNDGRRGYLHHLAVAAEWRRRGIGKALVRAIRNSRPISPAPKTEQYTR
jgi:ribosomal protein S18 acetylase RimI-like enzyme